MQTVTTEEVAPQSKTRRQWRCKKCDAHGLTASLRGHTSSCPFRNCTCKRCEYVMKMRLKSLQRRYRHHSSVDNIEFRTVREPNGNVRIRAVHKDEDDENRGTDSDNSQSCQSSPCPPASLSEIEGVGLSLSTTFINDCHLSAFHQVPRVSANLLDARSVSTSAVGTQTAAEESTVGPSVESPSVEKISPNLYLSPTANRNHPMFPKFLQIILEFERQMLV